MTVVGVEWDEVIYMPTKEAILQRYVDLDEVALYEQMGVCFGREKQEYKPKFTLHHGPLHRYL